MDSRPIGVFDSGLGGLTALRELRRILPGEEFVYFGDTARVPYGSKGRETLVRYSLQDLAFLNSFDPKAIVVACGTVSANALPELRAASAVPVFGVIEPAARAAAEGTKNGKIGVIATVASVRSGAYERAIAALDSNLTVIARPCPLFVPLVENGRYRRGDKVVELVAQEYLEPFRRDGADTLVLGCTHYPLLREVIAGAMGPDVKLIDVGAVCAAEAAGELERAGALRTESKGSFRCYVSDTADDFARLAAIFLGEEGPVAAQQVDIARF